MNDVEFAESLDEEEEEFLEDLESLDED